MLEKSTWPEFWAAVVGGIAAGFVYRVVSEHARRLFAQGA